MGKVAVPEAEYLLCAADTGGAGEIYAHSIFVLILGQYFIHNDTQQFPGFVTEPEPHWCDLSVCVGTGNHLYRHVNAQNAFQGKFPFLQKIFSTAFSHVIIIA